MNLAQWSAFHARIQFATPVFQDISLIKKFVLNVEPTADNVMLHNARFVQMDINLMLL